MLETIFTLVTIFTAYRLGFMRAKNMDSVKHNEHMQNLVDKAYEKRDAMKQLWIDSENKADLWQRRYDNLYKEIQLRAKNGS